MAGSGSVPLPGLRYDPGAIHPSFSTRRYRDAVEMRPALALALLALQTTFAAAAQTWPNRPIRMVIPFPPGGNVDTFGRVLFPYVEKELGQQLVVDNRGGANGLLGSDIVAKATPDGYTLMATSFGFAVNPAITQEHALRHRDRFAPVTDIALGAGYLMVGNPKVPAKTVKELIALARQQPGKIRYGTAGVGNGQHLAGALFAEKAGVDMLHVPYKGGGPAVIAVLGGEVQVHYPAPAVGIPHIKAGRLIGLGFTGKTRLTALPEVPTIAEAGVPGYYADAGWHGVFAPAKNAPRHREKGAGSLHQGAQGAARARYLLEQRLRSPGAYASGMDEGLSRRFEALRGDRTGSRR